MKKINKIIIIWGILMMFFIGTAYAGSAEIPSGDPGGCIEKPTYNLETTVGLSLLIFVIVPLATGIGIKKSLKNKKLMIDSKKDSESDPKKQNVIIAIISVGMIIIVALGCLLIKTDVNNVFQIIVTIMFLGAITSFLLKYCKKTGYIPFFVCNLLLLESSFVSLYGVIFIMKQYYEESFAMYSLNTNIGICLFLIGYNFAIYIFQLIGKKRLLDYWTIFSTAVVHFAMAFLFMKYNNIFLPLKFFVPMLLQGMLLIASICFCNLCKDETENNKYILIKDIIITLMVVMLIIFSIVLYK